jgi:hypothetical protein
MRIGLVHLQCGPVALAHIDRSVPAAPADVQVSMRLQEGYAVLVAR